MRSIDSSMKSSCVSPNSLKFKLESGSKKSASDRSIDLFSTCTKPFDWIEVEMARVCGEGMNGSEVNSNILKSSPFTSPSDTEYANPMLPLKRKDEQHASSNVPCNDFPKMDWRLLRQKHETELKKKLEDLEAAGGLEKRARLERRFTELFGAEELSPDFLHEKRKTRDDIVALTVKHLMPMYKEQRIASKELFKKLAKHISSSVVEKVKNPDEKSVQAKVQEYFCDKKSVLSDEDIYSK